MLYNDWITVEGSAMEPIRALVLDEDTCFADKLSAATFVSLRVDRAKSFAEFRKSAGKRLPDLFLLHESAKLSGIELLDELRRLSTSVPAIVLAPAASSIWQATLNNANVEVLCAPVHERELEYRIAKLTGQPKVLSKQPQPTRIPVLAVHELHNDNSGRLDAKLIAKGFGMSLADVSRSIGKKLQTVHQTPDSPALQKSLFPFERIASALLKLTGSEKGLKVWLNTPNDAFPGEFPIEVLKQGHGELLAEMLEDVLVGHPD